MTEEVRKKRLLLIPQIYLVEEMVGLLSGRPKKKIKKEEFSA